MRFPNLEQLPNCLQPAERESLSHVKTKEVDESLPLMLILLIYVNLLLPLMLILLIYSLY